MGTKSDEFEESTKIKSSAEIDEMLRKAAASRPQLEDDYENEFEAHTQIGNVSELIARSAIADPPPVLGRASTNVIRRAATPHPVARSSDVMAAVMPQGSLPEMPLPPKTDEDAFEPWDDVPDMPAKTAETPAPFAPTPEPVAAPIRVEMPIAPPFEVPVVRAPVVRAPLVVEQPTPQRLTWRWGVIAWVVLLVVTITVGTLSYMRIGELEDELAKARTQLSR